MRSGLEKSFIFKEKVIGFGFLDFNAGRLDTKIITQKFMKNILIYDTSIPLPHHL